MRDNKNKNVFVAVAVIAIIVVIGFLVSCEIEKESTHEPTGRQRVIASLEANSQSEVDEYIKRDLERNKYKLEDARIYINPYQNSPLSALLVFHTDKPESVSLTLKGKHGDDMFFEYEKSTEHYIPIFALYQEYENVITVTLSNGGKAEFKIPTGKLEFALEATVNTDELPQSDKGLYFLTTPLNMRSFAIDRYGEIRWYADGMYYHNIVLLKNGHFLIGNSDINGTGLSTGILEMDYLGRIYKSYEIDSGYINDFFVKDDGNILVASKNDERDTYSEYIIEINGSTGKVVKTWDLYQKMCEIDAAYASKVDRSDYFYNSGIEYYPSTDSLLLTYWGGDMVVNMSYNEGTIKWIFGDPKNFTSAFDGVLLKGGEGFAYPKSMHSAKLEGEVLRVFDNGYSTLNSTTISNDLAGSYSSANTYKISGKNIRLEGQIDEGKSLFSYALGDYKKLNGNDLVLFGRELENFDWNSGMDLNNYDLVSSRLIEKSNGATVLDIKLGWSTYSVTKVYPTAPSFRFDNMVSYTTLEPSIKEDLTDEIISMVRKSRESVPYEFGYSNGRIEHNVLFMSGDEAKLVLIDKDKKGAVYELKVKGESESERIITDLSNGKYFVYVLENGVMYSTDSYIEIV